MRPFNFMIPFWGAQYRQYFVDRCLPSLLSPNNFPLLRAEDGHLFFIATTRSDWQEIENLPIMQRVRLHVTPYLIVIDTIDSERVPGSNAAIYKQSKCQKLLVEAAYATRSYATLLWPDVIFADSLVTSLQRWAAAGHCLVLFASLRQTEETALEDLSTLGYLPKAARFAQTAQPIAIPPRIVAQLSVRHMHPEVASFEADDPRQSILPPFLFWRVPHRRGLIIHTMIGQPILMDYAAVDQHDTKCLDSNILEDVYMGRNFYGRGSIHVVQDSDEFGVLSLTPAAINQRAITDLQRPRKWQSWLVHVCNIRASMGFHARERADPLARDLFRLPIRWHADDLDETWRWQEAHIATRLRRLLGDYYNFASARPKHFPGPSLVPWRLPGDLYLIWRKSPTLLRIGYSISIVLDALSGDRKAWSRITGAIWRRVAR